jgi:hypothetical protein
MADVGREFEEGGALVREGIVSHEFSKTRVGMWRKLREGEVWETGEYVGGLILF